MGDLLINRVVSNKEQWGKTPKNISKEENSLCHVNKNYKFSITAPVSRDYVTHPLPLVPIKAFNKYYQVTFIGGPKD